MIITNWIESRHRSEAKRNTTQWHLIRSQLAMGQTWQTPGSLWHRVYWLSRIRDHLVVRARLRAYVRW